MYELLTLAWIVDRPVLGICPCEREQLQIARQLIDFEGS